MFAVAICPLGTLRIVRSSVRMRVERSPTRSTVPNVSPSFRKSPTRTALSKTSEKPPMTFSSVFCAASATAMPPMPSPARAAVASTPIRQRGDGPYADDQHVSDPPRESQQRDAFAQVRHVDPPSQVQLGEVVEQQKQPHRAADRETLHG